MLNRSLVPVFLISISIFLSACSFPFMPGKKAGLSITASPDAGIFIDEKHIGSTPYYNEKMKPGDYTVKIVPESGVGLAWESKVKLMPGIMTVISRQLSQTEEQSSGYFLTLEPGGAKDAASIEIVTVPDKSGVTVDGELKGFSPILLDKMTPGEHVVLITSPGFNERSINANLRAGHTLKASIQLSRADIAGDTEVEAASVQETGSQEQTDEVLDESDASPSPAAKPKASATPKATPKATAKPKPGTDIKPPYITVLDTPTGFLNVREEPSTGSENILAKIKPGESYKYIEKNTTGWYKIEISPGEEGWISSKYVKLTEE